MINSELNNYYILKSKIFVYTFQKDSMKNKNKNKKKGTKS